MAGHVSGRTGLQETGAVLDRICRNNDFWFTVEREERSRSKTSCIRYETENLQKIFDRKVDSAVGGERICQQKLFEAEAVVEARNWGKRNSDVAFQEIKQEFESQRFQLHHASRWADQAQRERQD